ncbi:MAG: cupin domain-containing protein [Myxococcaceae bacterium]
MKLTLGAAVVAVLSFAGGAVAKAADKSSAPTIVLPNDLKFAPATPLGEKGPQSAVVWGDPVKGPVGILLRVPAGFDSGVHTHTADYRGVILQGAVTATEADDKKAPGLPAGAYYLQPGKAPHNNYCASAVDCLIYIEFTNGGIDFKPVGAPPAK